MKKQNKPCKFEESILAQIGWREEDYKEQQLNICNLKMANNIRLTPQETKEYIQFSGERNDKS